MQNIKNIKIKKGQKVLVKKQNDISWYIGIFCYRDDDKFYCYHEGVLKVWDECLF